MKFSFKKVEYSPRNSEETLCFYAELYIDGKPALIAQNSGQGGASNIQPHPKNRAFFDQACKTLMEYGATIPPTQMMGMTVAYDDLDSIICKLLSDYLSEKELTRLLKTKVVMVENGGVFSLKVRSGFSPSDPAVIAGARKSYPNATVLNDLDPTEALRLYITASET